MGIINEAKTNAVPVSPCSPVSPAGIAIKSSAIIKDFTFSKLVLTFPIYLARARAVANFANSDGCNPKLPMLIQDLEPAISFPLISTKTSKTSVTA